MKLCEQSRACSSVKLLTCQTVRIDRFSGLSVCTVRCGPNRAVRRLALHQASLAEQDRMSIVPDWYTGETLHEDQPAKEALGSSGRRGVFLNQQHLKLATYFFPAEGTARALAVMVHGHGCSFFHEFGHSQKPGTAPVYNGSVIEALNQAGIAVAGLDLQGCGHSEGVRCYVDRYSDYVEEVLDFTRFIDGEQLSGFSGLPRFVIGASLGGCIAVDACRSSDLYRGAILIAPMISLEKISRSGLNPYLRRVSGVISWLLPQLQIAKTERNALYPDIQAHFDQDPQVWHGWTRARNATEYLAATEALCAELGSIDFPFLCFHGEEDTMTDPEGSKLLFEQAKSADKELHLIPERWHVLLKEPGCEELGKNIVKWILERA